MVFVGVWTQESEYRGPPPVQGHPTAHQRHEGVKGQGGNRTLSFRGGREECQRDAREKGFFLDSSCSDLHDRAELCGERPHVCARLATVQWAISSLGVSRPFQGVAQHPAPRQGRPSEPPRFAGSHPLSEHPSDGPCLMGLWQGTSQAPKELCQFLSEAFPLICERRFLCKERRGYKESTWRRKHRDAQSKSTDNTPELEVQTGVGVGGVRWGVGRGEGGVGWGGVGVGGARGSAWRSDW